MKFIRFLKKDKTLSIGILSKDEKNILEISKVLKGKKFDNIIDAIKNITKDDIKTLEKSIESNKYNKQYVNLKDVKVLAPIEKPIHDIICVGVNYRDHLEETKKELSQFTEPKKAVYFSKRAIKILGTSENIKGRIDLDEKLDYEAELAVIIGKKGHDIPKEKVIDYIFGYSIFNDISSRTLQTAHSQWFKGKSLDTYTAMGPVILYKTALSFPINVDIISKVNGEIRQSSNTKFFIHDIEDLISDISKGLTLEEGDIIATGTPGGVGMGFNPPRYMKKGDEVVCEIPEIGKLVNKVK